MARRASVRHSSRRRSNRRGDEAPTAPESRSSGLEAPSCPKARSDIRGPMRPEAELRAAAGYPDRTREFDHLIQILVSELRLVTPADPDGSIAERASAAPAGARYYQLTHDYLVHSLRDWLDEKRGRAEILLAERAALWCARPERRHLPSWPEYLYLQFGVRRRNRSAPQRRS